MENNFNDNETPEFLKGMNKNLFNAPDGYFDQLPDEIFHKIEKEELLSIAPTLFSIPKKEPFLAPRTYFEILPSMISKSIAEPKSRTGLFTWFNKKWAYTLSGIAVVVIAFIIGFQSEKQHADLSFSDVSLEEYDQYVEEDATWQFNETELSDLIAMDQANNKTDVSPEEKELEEYILSEVDLNEIIEEF